MEMFDLLAHRARVTPARPALEDLDSGERYDYAGLNERAARLAAAAREHWGSRKATGSPSWATAARNSSPCCSAAPRPA
ncbi:hypothetical protein ASALC70_00546 [Alcanivorax sp. ALC70]|nr:hypothetical protein ASALC70_00546 [Alcanivorax sp. ALC70]